jgi:hypothetical protein
VAAVLLGAGTALATARLELVTQAPMTVRGSGFAGHESVRVRLVLPTAEIVRRVRATRRGRFSVRFTRTAPDRCAGYAIVATGSRGSVARLRRQPRCPPA